MWAMVGGGSSRYKSSEYVHDDSDEDESPVAQGQSGAFDPDDSAGDEAVPDQDTEMRDVDEDEDEGITRRSRKNARRIEDDEDEDEDERESVLSNAENGVSSMETTDGVEDSMAPGATDGGGRAGTASALTHEDSNEE
jgi:hypothetical protein